jgi:hypothetical protein
VSDILSRNNGIAFKVVKVKKDRPMLELLDLLKEERFAFTHLPMPKSGFCDGIYEQEWSKITYKYFVSSEHIHYKAGLPEKVMTTALSSATIYFIPGFLICTGDVAGIKAAIPMLGMVLEIEPNFEKISNAKLADFKDIAAVIKGIRYTEIPDSDCSTMSMTGAMEDIDDMPGIPVNAGLISSFTGHFETPGQIVRTISVAANGTIKILKSKKHPISVELLLWVLRRIDV